MAIPDALTMRWLDKYRDSALLLIRVGAGLIFILHGWQIFAGGQDVWIQYGSQIQGLGIREAGPGVETGVGLAIAVSYLLGGILVALGLLARLAATAIFLSLLLAWIWEFKAGHAGVRDWSPLAVAALLFLGLMAIGPGRYSFDCRHDEEAAEN